MLQGDGLSPLPHPAADTASRQWRPLALSTPPSPQSPPLREDATAGTSSPSHPTPRPRQLTTDARQGRAGHTDQSEPGSRRPRLRPTYFLAPPGASLASWRQLVAILEKGIRNCAASCRGRPEQKSLAVLEFGRGPRGGAAASCVLSVVLPRSVA